MPQLPVVYSGETRNGACSFANLLDSDELLTGTPTVTPSPAGPTISNVAVNTSTLTIDGESVVAGKAVQCKVTGQSAATLYELTFTVSTDATPAQTFKRTRQFWVDS